MNLSVNINKWATLRNARGGNNPNILNTALQCEQFGANGITVHPRPDERHIKYEDVRQLKKIVKTEFNIEGNPMEDSFVKLVLETKPTQVTLVPDMSNQLTSNHGWDTLQYFDFLKNIISTFTKQNIRVSIFVNPIKEIIYHASLTGAQRIELYTEMYASQYFDNKELAIKPYKNAAYYAHELGLQVNAGHDLSLDNLSFFAKNIPILSEVSIGHALICDAIQYGLHNTIQMYQRCLHKNQESN